MKSVSFLAIIVSSCSALNVPLPGRNISGRLEVRIDHQQLINPDNEPPYQDATTGAMMEKSRILSGVGPPAADNRYFDWDESCIDADHRQKIYDAWTHFQELTTKTSTQLAALRANLPNPPADKGQPNPKNQEYIMSEDPAYTQMFKARDTGLQTVQNAFASITDNVKNYPGRGNGGPAALRFICNENGHVKNGAGASYCGTGPLAAEAVTLVPQDPADTHIEQKYRFQTSSSITFCPVFFDDKRFPNIEAVVKQPDPTLDTVDCRERIMLHEFLHLPWTRNMHPVDDYIGYYKAAKAAAKFRWNDLVTIPDCFAWYALYSFFNNEVAGCGEDIWPKGVDKPVKTS